MLSNEELLESITAKGGDPKCSSCGKARWSGHPGCFVPDEEAGSGFPAYLLICEECGLMRLHAKLAVEK
jgi:hypothetical protein